MRARICSVVSSTDLISPGYSSAVCCGVIAEELWVTTTACHASGRTTNGSPCLHRLAPQCQYAVAPPRDQSLAAQLGPDRHPALPTPVSYQRVHAADLLIGQPGRATGEQPAANHPASNRVGQRGQGVGL